MATKFQKINNLTNDQLETVEMIQKAFFNLSNGIAQDEDYRLIDSLPCEVIIPAFESQNAWNNENDAWEGIELDNKLAQAVKKYLG